MRILLRVFLTPRTYVPTSGVFLSPRGSVHARVQTWGWSYGNQSAAPFRPSEPSDLGRPTTTPANIGYVCTSYIPLIASYMATTYPHQIDLPSTLSRLFSLRLYPSLSLSLHFSGHENSFCNMDSAVVLLNTRFIQQYADLKIICIPSTTRSTSMKICQIYRNFSHTFCEKLKGCSDNSVINID